MKTKVARWGNSLAVRLPKSLTSELGFIEDGMVELEISDGQLLVRSVGKSPSLEDLVSGITPENRHAEVDWGPARGAEFS